MLALLILNTLAIAGLFLFVHHRSEINKKYLIHDGNAVMQELEYLMEEIAAVGGKVDRVDEEVVKRIKESESNQQELAGQIGEVKQYTDKLKKKMP